MKALASLTASPRNHLTFGLLSAVSLLLLWQASQQGTFPLVMPATAAESIAGSFRIILEGIIIAFLGLMASQRFQKKSYGAFTILGLLIAKLIMMYTLFLVFTEPNVEAPFSFGTFLLANLWLALPSLTTYGFLIAPSTQKATPHSRASLLKKNK